LWFLWRLAPGSGTYHVSWCYEVVGGLDVGRLAVAVDALVLRHEVLRTTLHEQEGQVVQRVGPPWRCGLIAAPAVGEQAAELAAASVRELFDLSAGPLLRVRAWELAPDRHAVAFTAHHVIMDGWSLEVFERELWALYQAGGDPVAAGLSTLDIQYADYAAWHRDLTVSRADDLAWWRQTLSGATPVCPAPDHPASEQAEFSGAQAAVTVSASTLDCLATFHAAAGTDFVTLFAVWCLFLARHTGQRDLTVGTLVSGRSHPDTAALIGYFVNTLALRLRVDPSTDFLGYLRQVRAIVLDAFAHQEIPFDHVVRAVAPRRSPVCNPLFTTLFSYTLAEAADWQSRTLADGLKLTIPPFTSGGSHSPGRGAAWLRYMRIQLSLTAARTPQGLALRLEYSTDLYDPATITGYLDSLTRLLAAVSHDPATPLHALLGDGQTGADACGGSAAEEAVSNGAGTSSADAEYVSPATDTEQRIARIWASLLRLDLAEIGASEDFFAIGGYSMLAVRLALRIGADLHIEFPLHQIFATPTVAGQAAYADELRGRAVLPSQG
jgi:signal transduction histidine kinase